MSTRDSISFSVSGASYQDLQDQAKDQLAELLGETPYTFRLNITSRVETLDSTVPWEATVDATVASGSGGRAQF